MSLVSQVVDYLDTRPHGATAAEIRAAIRHGTAKHGLSAASNRGLIVYVRGRWYRTTATLSQQITIEPGSIDVAAENAAADARFAALIGDRRYEDAKVKPLPLRALRAEPNVTLSGCAARMCAQ